MRPTLLILLTFLTACDDTEPGVTGGDAGACVTSDLIAQCPPGSSPLLGDQARSSCEAALGGVVQDAQGQATGQCFGVGSCRVVCQLAVPCRCGIERLDRDGVVCAPCEDAASCGNGVCEGGEDPQVCPIDCGAVCVAGERRCDGELLEECSLQGRFERLPCPQGEVCETTGDSAQCIRDPGVVIGEDAGVGADAMVRPDDGRLIPGDGTWPTLVGQPLTAPFPRALTPRWLALEGLGQPGHAAGSLERFRLIAPEVIEGVGTRATVRWRLSGEVITFVEPEYPPADVDAFCAAWIGCRRNDTPAQCAGFFEQYAALPHGIWQRDCIAAEAPRDCRVATGGQVSTCHPRAVRNHPEGVIVGIRPSRVVGDVVVAPVEAQTHMVAIDLATHTAQAHDPAGEYLIQHRYMAASADGRVAVAWAQATEADKALILWDRVAGTRRVILPRAVGDYYDMALSPDGQVLALTIADSGDPDLDAGVSLWNLAEERRILTLRGTSGRAVLAFSRDGQHLIVDVDGRTLEVWRLGIEPIKTHELVAESRVSEFAYGPDATTLALYEAERGLLSLWDTRTGERWWSFEVGRAFYPLAFSPDGQCLLAGGLLLVEPVP